MPKTQPAAPISPLPAGTLTFLFTDIEGSTKLWQEQGKAMAAALARHDALLRLCITAHDGYVFKTAGDAFCAAFATAADALAAALAAQQGLHAERWPQNVHIRTRMALHTGAAELRDGDYFGTPLNHVARLLAVAHGGQTLLTAITRDLCLDRLPADTELKSLGQHGLKDLPRREAIFQLCHPDLPQVFPPLKTLLAPIDADTPSIAVLPFTDLSPGKDQEYFTDGLAEELLNVLAKIRGLRVASRTSAFFFKGKDVDLATIAQRLNVATILEGSVRKAGNRVRITTQLIQVATDSHLWSETYNRQLEDIFAVQDDIARSVVKELRTKLLGERSDALAREQVSAEVQAAARGRGENAEAYRVYLQARFFAERFTPEDTAKAIDYYRQALRIDAEYGLAWAGLSQCYSSQAAFSWDLGTVAGFDKAREAAERALRLAPDLAEGHAALGRIRMIFDWDWKGADQSLRRALELAPGDAEVIGATGFLARNLGRMDEALALYRRAVALDPLSSTVHRRHANVCFHADLLDEAEFAMKRVLELNPQAPFMHFRIGEVRLRQGRLADALGAFQKEGQRAFRLVGLAQVYHARGQLAESEAALQELIATGAADAAFQIAEVYAYRGEADLAFEWLERAYVQRDAGMASMKISQHLKNLHDDPRWQPFLEKMGLVG